MSDFNQGRRPYDDLETDYLEEENESGFLSLMSVIIAFLAVAVFIALAWYAYQSSNDTVKMEDIEVVYPDDETIREAPSESGGWQFPHQDKSVYDMVAGGDQRDIKVEKIMPAPEQPVERPEVKTQTWINKEIQDEPIAKTDAERQKEAEQVQAEQPVAEQPAAAEVSEAAVAAEEKEAPAVAKTQPEVVVTNSVAVADTVDSEEEVKAEAPKPVEKVAEKPKVVEKPKPVVVAKPAPAPAPVVSSGGVSSVRAQLGAFRSRADADAQWRKIQAKYGAQVAGKSSHVEVVQLPDKGTFYRLQIVPFTGKDAAKTLCTKMSAQKQPCFVVVK